MNIQAFNGGLNTRLSPFLVPQNEALELHNASILDDKITSLKTDLKLHNEVDKYFYGFKDNWFSYRDYTEFVPYRDKLIINTVGKKPLIYYDGKLKEIGVSAPEKAPGFLSLPAGKFDVIDDPEVVTVPEVSEPDISDISGSMTNGAYSFRLVRMKEGVNSIPYDFTYNVSTGGIRVEVDSDEHRLYRKVDDSYYLVASGEDSLEVTDNSYSDKYEDIRPFPVGITLEYKYVEGFGEVVDKEVHLPHGEKTIKVILHATGSYPVKYYRKYERDYFEVPAEDKDYETLGDEYVEYAHLEGVYQYCYTYYDDEDGTESAPSPYTGEKRVDGGVKLDFEKPTDSRVTHIRIYRLGGYLTVMTLVDTIELAEVEDIDNISYIDGIADVDVDGYILESFNHQPIPKDILYITEYNASFFGALEDKLYFSQIDNVNYWYSLSYIQFSEDITGIGTTPNGLMVFTKNKSYIITGTGIDNYVRHLVSEEQGCVSHKSINHVGGNLVWLSTDGICGSVGGAISLLTKSKIDKLQLEPVQSVVLDEIYYLLHAKGVFAMDTRQGVRFYTMDLGWEYIEVYEDELYACKEGRLYKCFQGEDRAVLTYTSPKLTEGQLTMSKLYNDIYIAYEGELNLKILIDDKVVGEYNLAQSEFEVKNIAVPADQQRGHYIQFSFSGVGSLYEIDYKLVGRQNGK